MAARLAWEVGRAQGKTRQCLMRPNEGFKRRCFCYALSLRLCAAWASRDFGASSAIARAWRVYMHSVGRSVSGGR